MGGRPLHSSLDMRSRGPRMEKQQRWHESSSALALFWFNFNPGKGKDLVLDFSQATMLHLGHLRHLAAGQGMA